MWTSTTRMPTFQLLTYLLGRETEQALEGSSKVVVEDGIDDRVEEAVDVAEPD